MTDDIEPLPPRVTVVPPLSPLSDDYVKRYYWDERIKICVGIEVAVAVLGIPRIIDSVGPHALDNVVATTFALVMLAQWLVAAIWLGAGRTALWIRLVPVAMPLIVPLLIGWWIELPAIAGLLVSFALLLAAPGAIAKIFGLHVVLVVGKSQGYTPLKGNLRQFSLMQMFVWTTMAAILAAMYKSELLKFPEQFTDLNYPVRLALLLWGIIFVISAWAVLSGIRFAVIATLGGGVCLTAAISAIGHQGVFVSLLTIVQQLLVMLVLLPFRIAGFRLRWTPSDGRSPDPPPTNA